VTVPGYGAVDPLYQVHILAVKYHWARSEILEMPSWERRAYLKFVLDEQRELEREIEKAKNAPR